MVIYQRCSYGARCLIQFFLRNYPCFLTPEGSVHFPAGTVLLYCFAFSNDDSFLSICSSTSLLYVLRG
jgi:hypothetical protein